MIKIFDYVDDNVTLNTIDILLVREFEDLWQSDKSKNKEKAFQYFKYLYLLCDIRSPYKDYSDAERMNEAILDSKLTEKELSNPLLLAAKKKYEELLDNNRLIRFIHSMYKSIEKLEVYFITIDFTLKVTEGARKGTLLHSPTELINSLTKARQLAVVLKELEEEVKQELSVEEHIRGGGEKSLLMDDEF